MRIKYTLSEEAERAHGGWSSRLLPVFGGLLVLAGIFARVGDQQRLGNAIAAVLIGVALMFGQRILWFYSFRQD